MAKRRTNTPVELSSAAKSVVDSYAAIGMSRRAVVEKVLLWFASQDDVVRGTIMGTVPESIRADVARQWMERQAKDQGGKKRAG